MKPDPVKHDRRDPERKTKKKVTSAATLITRELKP